MNLSFDFTGRTALVTGAAQGIGFELCWMFAESGAKVIPVDPDSKALKSTWGSASEYVFPLALDVADSNGTADLISTCAEWGGLDIVINTGQIGRDGHKESLSDSEWSELMTVQLRGATNVTRSALPLMQAQKRGRIVNLTSYVGIRGLLGDASYSDANTGIVGFTKTVAKEVIHCGITVNVVSTVADAPVVVDLPPERKSELTRAIPLGYFESPREISCAVGFLASDEASYITGIVLPVDGGISM